MLLVYYLRQKKLTTHFRDIFNNQNFRTFKMNNNNIGFYVLICIEITIKDYTIIPIYTISIQIDYSVIYLSFITHVIVILKLFKTIGNSCIHKISHNSINLEFTVCKNMEGVNET